jgi:hypothetical protein
MTKLTDTQLVVLSAACQRPDRNLLPLPANLKGGAAQKVVAGLVAKGLVEEVSAAAGEPVWRTGEDGSRFGLVATNAAFHALGIEADGAGSGKAADTPAPAGNGAEKAGTAAGEADNAEAAPVTRTGGSRRKARTDTKQAQLIAMLVRPEGASLDEIVAATGWQAHTVRGAIAGALKKKLGLTITSEKLEGRGRVYRTAV